MRLIEQIAQATFSGDDEDAWARASEQWRRDRIDDLRRGLALLGCPEKADVWKVAFAVMNSTPDDMTTHDAERYARAAMEALADLP